MRHEMVWKKCKKCQKEWARLTPKGFCPECEPEYFEFLKPVKPLKNEVENYFKGGDRNDLNGNGRETEKRR